MSALFVADQSGGYRLADEAVVLQSAAELASAKLKPGTVFRNPSDVRLFLPALLSSRQHEVFCVAWLDTHRKLIKFEEMYQGSLDEARVYPREVIKRGLELNAGAMFIVHNHPSGNIKPSEADVKLSFQIRLAASLMEITMLDHFLVAGGQVISLENQGLLSREHMRDYVLETVGPEYDMGEQLFKMLVLGGRRS